MPAAFSDLAAASCRIIACSCPARYLSLIHISFSEKPYRDGEDFNPYVFDGSMSIEDFELMHLSLIHISM